MGQSEPGRIRPEGIKLDPSGWDPRGSNQTRQDGAGWARLDPNRSNWTGEDEAEQERMGSDPKNIRASAGIWGDSRATPNGSYRTLLPGRFGSSSRGAGLKIPS